MTLPKQAILFIVNPISGGHNKLEISKAIPELIDKNKFLFSIVQSEYPGHTTKIAKNAVKQGVDIVVAVGGDGTINEIAAQLVNTNTALGIIPCGSGNGLARDLGISLQYRKAIQQINTSRIKKIDAGICNEQFFFSLTGVGYDAKVAYDFNRSKKRKFFGYAWAILKDYFFAKEQHYKIELERETIEGHFFFIAAANCSQWGYGVKVAPAAQLDDNILEIILCKKPPIYCIIPFIYRLLSGKIDTSSYSTCKTSEKLVISSNNKFFYHLDGDAKGITKVVNISLLYKALNILN